MVTLNYDFNGGTAGSNISLSGSGSGDNFDSGTLTATNATFAYSSLNVHSGFLSGAVNQTATTANSVFATWAASLGTVTSFWFRFYIYITANPTAQTIIMRVYTGTSTFVGSVRIATDGKMNYSNASGVLIATAGTALVTNSWNRVEGSITPSTGAVDLRVFVGSNVDGATADATATGTGSTATNFNEVRFGRIVTADSGTFWLDGIGVTNTTWLGPTTTTYSESLAVTSALVAGMARQAKKKMPLSLLLDVGLFPIGTADDLSERTHAEDGLLTKAQIESIATDEYLTTEAGPIADEYEYNEYDEFTDAPVDALEDEPGSLANIPPGVKLVYNFNGGVVGYTVDKIGSGSGNPFDSGSFSDTNATFAYSSTHAHSGGLSGAVNQTATTSNSVFATWDESLGSVDSFYFRFYVYFTANPTASTIVMRVYAGTVALAASVRIGTDGKPNISNPAGASVATSSVALTLNAWNRIEGHIVPSTGAVELRVFVGSNVEGLTPSSTATGTVPAVTNLNQVNIGKIVTADSGTFWLDDLAITDRTWLGALT